jgi:hypothetical protein
MLVLEGILVSALLAKEAPPNQEKNYRVVSGNPCLSSRQSQAKAFMTE